MKIIITITTFIFLLSACCSDKYKFNEKDMFLCQQALDSILCGESHKIVNIVKTKETTHLQWCYEQHANLALHRMLCEDDLTMAKMRNNQEQAHTATKNIDMYSSEIRKIIAEQDTATNKFVYEQMFEVTYENEGKTDMVDVYFLNGKLQY